MTLSTLTQLPIDRGPRRPRVALYSHDTQGLGHLRRNLSIAGAFAGSFEPPDILLLSGARELRSFPLPASTDCVTLPALRKDVDGRYGPQSLNVSLDEVIRLRAATIHAAVDVFDPDVLIVDKVARGAFGELEPLLATLRARGRAQVVLGLRDVLDAPVAACREWERDRSSEAIERYYDQVWVYGDRRVYDPVLAYDLPDSVARKVTFTGYLGGPARLESKTDQDPDTFRPDGPYVFCGVGGGQDGYELASAFVGSTMPEGKRGLLVCGPYMPEEATLELAARAEGTPVRDLSFVHDPGPLMAGACAVIGMGGYNTTVELLSCDAPALIVPRTRPRQEQLVRAERLGELGVIDVLRPAELSSTAISAWLRGSSRRPIREQIDLAGLDRLPELLAGIIRDRDAAKALSYAI